MSVEEFIEETDKLDSGNSVVPDGIRPRILKKLQKKLLALVSNLSFKTGSVLEGSQCKANL